MMTPADDVTLTLTECAEWVGRSPRTLRRWVAQGQLVPRTRDRHGRDLYRMSDLCRLERHMRRNRAAGVPLMAPGGRLSA